MTQHSTADDMDGLASHLQEMSERLETHITAAVRTILERSGYFHPSSLDALVMPVAGWACGLPYEAQQKGYVITPRGKVS
jgi:hypothetical protein